MIQKHKNDQLNDKFAWQEEGRAALQSLRRQFSGVVGIVGPHYLKTVLNQNIRDLTSRICEENGKSLSFVRNTWVNDITVSGHWRRVQLTLSPAQILPVRRNFAAKLVLTINEEKLRRTSLCKFRLLRKYWDAGFQIDRYRVSENMCHHFIEIGLRKRIRISPKDIMNLTMRRNNLKFSKSKLEEITSAITRNESVKSCKAAQHHKPSGCPVCKSTLTRQGTMVLSIDRKTGVSALVPVDFELELLNSEKIEQLASVKLQEEELHVVTIDLQDKLSRSIQDWWVRKMARRRSERAEKKLQLSLWNFRNRKLVVMMKMINAGYSDAEVERAFPYFTRELYEYSAVRLEKKAEMVKKVAIKFLENLRTAVIIGRRKKFKAAEEIRREEALVEMQKEEGSKLRGLALLRARVYQLENQRYYCMRPQCKNREFRSIDRYNTHLSFHRREDDENETKRKAAHAAKEFRGKIEDEFLERIRAARFHFINFLKLRPY